MWNAVIMNKVWEDEPTRRFSTRVDNYVKYRPTYPPSVFTFLNNDYDFRPDSIVADIGSGTGIFTSLLLDNGNEVFAVEPNDRMRQVAENTFADRNRFRSVKGTAEATTLPPQSIEFITCAQSFHWFDLERTRVEFLRVLKESGVVALIWNDRVADGTPFMKAYEVFLEKWSVDYKQVSHTRMEKDHAFDRFFEREPYRVFVAENSQRLDFEALKGRLLSSSYAPHEYHPNYADMLRALEVVFKHYVGSDGEVEILYKTKVFAGRLSSKSL
jgi:ubiquinone/menaquinone biosynthesis C-methylase UbiE